MSLQKAYPRREKEIEEITPYAPFSSPCFLFSLFPLLLCVHNTFIGDGTNQTP
jgi:hypothetical protein